MNCSIFNSVLYFLSVVFVAYFFIEGASGFNVCSGKTMWLAYQEAKEASSVGNCGQSCDLYFHCMASYKAVHSCPGSMKDKRATAKYISSIDAKEFATALGDPVPYVHTSTTSAPVTKASSASISSKVSSSAASKQRFSRHHSSSAAAAAAAKEQKKRETERAVAAENGRLGQDCEELYLNNSKYQCTYQPQIRKC